MKKYTGGEDNTVGEDTCGEKAISSFLEVEQH